MLGNNWHRLKEGLSSTAWLNSMSVILLSFAAVGCLPKDTSLSSLTNDSTAPSNAVTYGGFEGAKTAQTVGATKVKVSWDLTKDPKVVAYNVYDATFRFNPKLVKTVSANSSEATITGLAAGTYYAFRVRAADEKNVEDTNTKDLGAIPYAGVMPAVVKGSTSASIPFNDGSNADQVNIYCKSGSTDYQLLKGVTNVTLTEALLTGLTPGTEYTCRAALVINGFIDNNTVTTTFTPIGQATSLVFSTQPGSAAAGANLSSQPIVTIKDANGNTVSAGPDANSVITLTVSSNSPTQGTIRGVTSASAVNGVATFTGLNMQEAGIKIITATKTDTSSLLNGSGPLPTDSSTFTISPGNVSPTKSTITISPAVPPNSALVANGTNSYTVSILLQDQYGNAISGIKPTFASNIAGDTLSQPAAQTDITGVTSGSISSTVADTTPVRSLSINSPTGLSTVSVLCPFVAGQATKLAYVTQPVNSPAGLLGMSTIKVAIQDAQGNVVTTGTGSNAPVTVSIASNVNGATLSGTVTANAVNGIATFSDLGIDKTQTGYKILASSGSYSPAYSNSFNVTAGTPHKIVVNAPATVVSGTCSSSMTLQLQDLGGNPTNAIQNTPVSLTGLGSASLYTSSVCGGTALSSTITFTAGTNTKTVYIKDMKGEQLNFAAADTSAVLTSGTATIKVTPSQLSILAQAPPPATPGSPLNVVAGKCSSAIYITTMGENGQPSPLFSVTPVSVSGISASSGQLYSDSACTQVVSASSVPLPATNSGTNYSTAYYFKDSKAELLNVSVADPAGMVTTSGLQTIQVLASNINLTGPSSVVAGKCSSAFTATLKDAMGNPVSAIADTALSISGISGSTTATFYSNSACSGTAITTSITIPQNSSQMQLFLKDSAAETLHIKITDPGLQLADSQTVNIGISPSALQIVTPGASSSASTACVGPFSINTLDGASAITAAITPITVNLTGAGPGGNFFTDNSCTTTVSTFTFALGDSTKSFYFMGQYPAASLTFTATDAAAVLSVGTASWAVTAAPGWIGTRGSMSDASGNAIWFTPGVVPVSARTDGPSSAQGLHFDSTHQYLFVVDTRSQRILKYDYLNKQYIGWIGQYNWSGGIGVTGSSLSTPSSAQCIATVSGKVVPGWCQGGFSTWNTDSSYGSLRDPQQMTDDGTYIYVTNWNSNSVTRYMMDTGAFAGYLGRVSTTPTGAGTGPNPGPGTCTSGVVAAPGNPTPGFCIGGASTNAANALAGNGLMNNPRAIAYDSGYLYVSTIGAILRFSTADGTFAGWVGQVSTTAPTGGAAGCTTTGNNVTTPGWCMGGTFQQINPKSNGGGGVNQPTSMIVNGGILYVVHTDNGGTITKYNASTGAYLGYLPNLSYNWSSPGQISTDGTNFFIADWQRIIKIDNTGLVLGWFGKVANALSMSGNAGCSTLVPNANTPGFCLGGTSKHGLDDGALNQATAIEYDGAGHLITGQGSNYPALKQWDSTTGVYIGTMSYRSISPQQWSNDSQTFAQYHGFDDYSMYTPEFSYYDTASGYLFLVELDAARIKKIDPITGKTLGWIGGITTSPTGGGTGCTSATAMGPSPNWCLGSYFNPNYLWNYMINYQANGIMHAPMGITGDGTYLYTTDYYEHRIQKWKISDGSYQGWVGGISTPPTGGATGCVGASAGTFTPGWCTGGFSTYGQADGYLWNPVGITYVAGKLYVVDTGSNHRVSSYDATTGAFLGWIGRISSTTGLSVCSYASNTQYNVSTNKWCKGGTPAPGNNGGDKGGGFYFSGRSGIVSDGTYLYIANSGNQRIDKYDLSGVWQGAAPARYDNYTGVWSNNATTVGSYGCGSPYGLAVDNNYIYATGTSCGTYNSQTFKINKSTGTVVGWKGAPRSDYPPNAGDPGCAGATIITPGWCQGGGADAGYRLGGFINAYGISVDNYFIYVSDDNNHRVTRLPK